MNSPDRVTNNGLRPTLSLLALALLAIPFAFAQSNIQALEDNPLLLLTFGVISLGVVGAVAYWGIVKQLPAASRRSAYPVFFAVFAFAAVIDLLIGLTLLGYTDAMRSYIDNGEPYLNSHHGMAVNLWDGSVHFALYLWMMYCMATAREHLRSALFWAGSMSMSVIVFMLGNTVGPHAEHIEPAYLLNVPFMIVPVLYAIKVVSESKNPPPMRSPATGTDWLLAGAILGVVGISLYRFLVVLNPDISLTAHWAAAIEPYLLDTSRYPEIHMMAFGLYLLPYGIFMLRALLSANSTTMMNWAWLMAGGVAQAQFAYMLGAYRWALVASVELSPVFWVINAAVLLIPLAVALRLSARGLSTRGAT